MSPDSTDLTSGEEAMLVAFMRRLHTAPTSDSPHLPDMDVLWLKARLIRQWDAQRKVQQPIDVMEPFELVASVAAVVLLLLWCVPSALAWIPRFAF